jgi:hypothetical protein
LYQGYWVSFPAVKQPGCSGNPPPPSGAEVEEWVQLYFYVPPSNAFMACDMCINQLQPMFYSLVLHSLSLLSLIGVTILHLNKKILLNLKASDVNFSVNVIKTQTVSGCSHTGIMGLKLTQDTDDKPMYLVLVIIEVLYWRDTQFTVFLKDPLFQN